ncbi:MAG: hypothetical protein ACR2LE_05015 [Nocardioidaceae bacterium]
MAERVFLHVGTPKSGTTYLQSVLWHNAAALKKAGLLLPARFQVHYAAAKSITSATGMSRNIKVDVDNSWPRLAVLINRWHRDAAVSHELLASASAEQAAAALALLDADEVHIVLTVRALHKQLPASWQEQVKGGLAMPYDGFVQRVRSREAKGSWFWRVQDAVDVADRWARDLPSSRVHVVIVPADSSDPTLLWQRFASVLRLDPAAYDARVPRRNESLGPVESELLRRVHAVRDARFTDRDRHQWTRKLLASEVLGHRSGGAIRLPDNSRDWLSAASAEMVQDLRRQPAYDVVGDLEDLRWQDSPDGARLVESVTDPEVDALCAEVITALQEELMRREPSVAPPNVGPRDGVTGLLELLEHIRAADTGARPRPTQAPSGVSISAGTARLRRSLGAWRGR